MTSVVRSPVRRRSRGRWPPAGAARVVMSVPLVSVISSIPLVVVSWRPLVSVGLPVSVLAVSILSVSVIPVPVLVIPVTISVTRITMVVVVPIVTMSRRTVVVSIIFVVTSFVVWWRSTIVMSIPVVVMTIVMPVSATAISAAAATWLTEAEPGTCRLAVVEVDPGRRPVGRVGDREVYADFKTWDFCPVQGLSGLLCVLDCVKVDEGKSSRPLGRSIQHHLDSLNLAIPTKLSLQIPISGGEVQTKDTETFGWSWIFSVSINLCWSWVGPRPRPWRAWSGARSRSSSVAGVARSTSGPAPRSGSASWPRGSWRVWPGPWRPAAPRWWGRSTVRTHFRVGSFLRY